MKENNIEEDIKILENMNDGYTFKDCDICNNYNEKTKQCDKHKCMELQAIEHILSDYKKLQKENEILKEEKEQAWEEWNNLERGSYETKQKLKQQIKELQKENEELKSDNLEYQRIQDIFDKRTYRKKYLEERRKEEPNLLYPDADEIYRRYYELKKENQQLRN